MARLVPIDPGGERQLGFVAFDVPVTFFDELPTGEVAHWDGQWDSR